MRDSRASARGSEGDGGRGGPRTGAGAVRSRQQVPPRPRLGPPPGCGMIDSSLAANRTGPGAGRRGPALGAERYLRRAAWPEEAAQAGAHGWPRLCALAFAERLELTRDCGAELSEGAGAHRVGRRTPSGLLGTPSSRFPCSERCPAPRPIADGAPSLGSTHALRAPGVVGCSCPRLRDRRWLRGRGGRQWIAIPATSSSGCSSNSAPWRCCSPKVGARRDAPPPPPRAGVRGVPGRSPSRAFEAGRQGFVSGGRGSLSRWSPQVATSC